MTDDDDVFVDIDIGIVKPFLFLLVLLHVKCYFAAYNISVK
jgi:hypothetical protein